MEQATSYKPPFDLSRPVFPDLLRVVQSSQDFSSKLTVLKAFEEGQVVCDMKGNTVVPEKAWTTVQIASNPESHIELQSELVYMNHSCTPSVRLDCKSRCLIALRHLSPGDEVTFFYPSTEWSMAKPFECWCGRLQDEVDLANDHTVTSTEQAFWPQNKCCKMITGAKNLTAAQRIEFASLLEPHIVEMLDK